MLIVLKSNSAAKLGKHNGMDKALAFLSNNSSFTLRDFVSETGLPRGTAQLILKDLTWTEHISRAGGRKYIVTEKVAGDALLVNVRDVRTDILFKRRGMKELLFQLARGATNLSEIAEKSGVSIRTIKRALKDAREAGIVTGFEISPKMQWLTSDPLDNVPRRAHASVLRKFISLAESKGPLSSPLILFGGASWGMETLTLNVLALFKIGPGIHGHVDAMEMLVLASKTITSDYGVGILLKFAATEAWLCQKLKITTSESPLLNEAFEGICIHGVAPSDEEYFKLLRESIPFLNEQIESWLSKGFLEKANGKYVLTYKGVEMLRQTAPSDLVEGRVPVFDKNIPFISIRPSRPF
jgi:hypothetical protein